MNTEKTPSVVHSDEVLVDKDFDAEAAAVDPGDKALSAIGYFSILCILPLILRPKSEYCLFHGKQSLAILVSIIPFTILARLLAVFGVHLGLFLVTLGFFLVQLYGAFLAWKGKKTAIPPFSTISDKFLIWGKKIADTYESTDSARQN